jgi:hypothetical protein
MMAGNSVPHVRLAVTTVVEFTQPVRVAYSSLRYLTMIPFGKIKIDRSFTMNMTKRADCAAIVAAVIALGQSLHTQTVAEGVETEQQLAILRMAGVILPCSGLPVRHSLSGIGSGAGRCCEGAGRCCEEGFARERRLSPLLETRFLGFV